MTEVKADQVTQTDQVAKIDQDAKIDQYSILEGKKSKLRVPTHYK